MIHVRVARERNIKNAVVKTSKAISPASDNNETGETKEREADPALLRGTPESDILKIKKERMTYCA